MLPGVWGIIVLQSSLIISEHFSLESAAQCVVQRMRKGARHGTRLGLSIRPCVESCFRYCPYLLSLFSSLYFFKSLFCVRRLESTRVKCECREIDRERLAIEVRIILVYLHLSFQHNVAHAHTQSDGSPLVSLFL